MTTKNMKMKNYTKTYDESEAKTAERKMNARRRRLGFPPSHIRSFQKSLSDGKGDLFTITLQDGEPVDVTRDFDPIF
jgi:hypothetical protein